MITTSLVLSLLFTAAPPSERQCMNTWARAKAPKAAMTDGCIDLLLTIGYGAGWDHESLTLDPRLHGELAIEQSTEALDAVDAQLARVCAEPTPEKQAAAKRGGDDLDELWTWRCTRAREIIGQEKAAKMGISDSVDMPEPHELLKELLAGEALTWEALMPHGEGDVPCFSRVSLWKFRNAPYARHGFKFKTEDLNRFFYDARPEGLTDSAGEPIELLPLPRGTHAKVTLTPTDHKNVALVIKAQKACYKE